MAELGAFFGNPNIQRQGARTRALASQRDVNTLPDPLTYAVMQGLLGTRPDEMGFSVLNPDYEKIKKVAEPAFALGLLGQAAPVLAPLTKGLPVGTSIKNIGNDIFKLSKEEFLGSPKITKNSNASDLKPIQLNTLKEVEPQPFMGGKYEFKMNEDGAVVLDKGKPIASYNFGNTLVVDKAHRKSGIAQELVYEWRTTYPAPAKADMRTKASQDIQEKVWDRIQREKEFLPQQEFAYPQKEALEAAQRNAALPVEKGGLGLPKDNTPEMRAQAMGFETPTYHGTNEDIGVFNVEGKGKTSGAGAFLTSNPTAAETYVSSSGGGNILPLLLRKDDFLTANARGRNWADIFTNELSAKAGKKRYTPEDLNLDRNSATSTDELGMIANELGLKGAEIRNVKDLGPNSHVMRAKEYLSERYGITPDETWSNVSGKQFDEAQKYMKQFYESQKGDIYAIQDPSLIRSRFAAFDPMRKNEPDILAGVLPLGLLTDEDQRKKLYEMLPSLLGQ
jgi:hypothetical protein